jgi:t-SNARE complex subunit (syntaxin)
MSKTALGTKKEVDKQADKAEKVQAQVDEVVQLMQNNVEKVIARGEKLEAIQQKSEGERI